jgi:galactokinase
MTSFESRFGPAATVTAEAPGRVNLIGEHTDYNGGFVLPTAIPQRSWVALAPRADQIVRVSTTAAGLGDDLLEYRLGSEAPGRGWLDYVQGVTRLLRSEDHPIRGFDARIDSAVPVGSGLSSSAALTVSLMRALRQAFDLHLKDVTIALFGQRVENEFVGARVGIMDPMAATLCESGKALFLDARSLAYQSVPLPAGADLVVIHSGISHRLTTGNYNTRRQECERAATLLGVGQLREASQAELPRIMALPEPLGRRARHVITENDRVLAAVDAMRAADLTRLGRLFLESHRSMRDDYEVSIPEIDVLVELAQNEAAVFGARLTGGGFGGSVVMLTRAGCGRSVAEAVVRAYGERAGQRAKILVPPDSP